MGGGFRPGVSEWSDRNELRLETSGITTISAVPVPLQHHFIFPLTEKRDLLSLRKLGREKAQALDTTDQNIGREKRGLASYNLQKSVERCEGIAGLICWETV